MIDIHSHILPHLDDGAKDIMEALNLCRIAEQDGIKTMVATPHNPQRLSLENSSIVCQSLPRLNRAPSGFFDNPRVQDRKVSP